MADEAYNLDDPQVLGLAIKFAGEAFSGLVKASLTKHANGVWFTNPASGANYNLYPIAGREPKSGMYPILMDAKMNPYRGKYGANWIAVLDLSTSDIYLVRAKTWQEKVDAALANPAAFCGQMVIQQEQGWYIVWFNPEWAIQCDLAKMHAKLSADKSFAQVHKQATRQTEQFCHLHVHSMFSLLDGVADVSEIARRAAANGQPGIALTDHGYMFGTFKFWNACKKHEVKPLVGCEFYLVDDVKQPYVGADGTTRRFEYHQTVLAMNEQGWHNISKLASMACRDNFYYVPRIDHNMLALHNDGLIVLSGCFKGPAAWHLQRHDPKVTADLPWYSYNPARSRQVMEEYRRVFGDRYYIELQAIDYEPYMQVVPELAAMARDLGIPCVVTNDCHYETEEDAILQAVMSRIGNKGGVSDGIGDKMVQKGCYFIKKRAQIQQAALTPDMFDRTCEIMERCNVDLGFKGYLFPEYKLAEDVDWPVFQANGKAAAPETGNG